MAEGVGVVFALLGLALLTFRPGVPLNRGDLLVAMSAVAFAVHFVLVGRCAPHHNARNLALVQMAVAALGLGFLSMSAERLVAPRSGSVWFALILTGGLASALAFLIQAWAQSILSPTRTAVTYTMEPLFAAMAGFALLDERLTLQGWAGAALILAATLSGHLAHPSSTGLARELKRVSRA